MELCLLLLPVAVLLGIGGGQFPGTTAVFVGLMLAYGFRFARAASRERSRSRS